MDTQSNYVLSWVLVAQASNPSYLEAEIGRIVVPAQPKQKVYLNGKKSERGDPCLSSQ
jgi:hypothetical protein